MLAASAVPAAPTPPQPQNLWTDAPVTATRPSAPPQSIAQLARQAMPAVVGIVAVTTRGDPSDPFHDFLERRYGSGGEREQPVRGIGTGFFVRSDGLLATNGHVVEGATEITVQLAHEARDPIRYPHSDAEGGRPAAGKGPHGAELDGDDRPGPAWSRPGRVVRRARRKGSGDHRRDRRWSRGPGGSAAGRHRRLVRGRSDHRELPAALAHRQREPRQDGED